MLIVFSGLDGSGKSTQINLLLKYFQQKELETRYLWTRGGYTKTFELVKKIIRLISGKRIIPSSGPSQQRSQAFKKPLVRKVWLGIAILDLIYIYGLKIRFWKFLSKIVICDRYLEDTLLDFHLNFPQEKVENWFLWHILMKITSKPDIAFLILVPVSESIRRSDLKGEPFRDTKEILTFRFNYYTNLIEKKNWHNLDGCKKEDVLATEILSVVEHKLNRPDLND